MPAIYTPYWRHLLTSKRELLGSYSFTSKHKCLDSISCMNSLESLNLGGCTLKTHYRMKCCSSLASQYISLAINKSLVIFRGQILGGFYCKKKCDRVS